MADEFQQIILGRVDAIWETDSAVSDWMLRNPDQYEVAYALPRDDTYGVYHTKGNTELGDAIAAVLKPWPHVLTYAGAGTFAAVVHGPYKPKLEALLEEAQAQVRAAGLSAGKVWALADRPDVVAIHRAVADRVLDDNPVAAVVTVGPHAERIAGRLDLDGQPVVSLPAWPAADSTRPSSAAPAVGVSAVAPTAASPVAATARPRKRRRLIPCISSLTVV